ncbi:MAG: type II secretion system F family protein [Candidatus Komeilibacteria bacterium]|nr:type II secretion system F family protein [Candidatus Komeilibacteria bacterium]
MASIYTFCAQTRKGRVVLGRIRHASRESVKAILEKKYAKVFLVELAPGLSLVRYFGPRISKEERLLFIKNLQVVLRSGVPLAEALTILRDQSDTKSMSKITGYFLTQVQAGNTLALSLGHYPFIFDPFVTNMIYVGEKSGTLEKSLGFLAIHLEHDIEIRRKVKAASIYPALILTATALLGAGMMLFVFPKLLRVFKSINVELPTSTRVLIATMQFFSDHGALVLTAILVGIVSFRLLLRVPKARLLWQRFFLHVPLFGSLSRSFNMAIATRTLGVLLEAGMPLFDGLVITAQSMTNLYFKTELLKAKDKVEQGQSLGDSLGKNKQFAGITARLIDVGEQSGNLETNLLYLSDFYSNKIDYATRNLSTIIEPVLLITIGLVVAFVAISILSPIFEFTGAVGR